MHMMAMQHPSPKQETPDSAPKVRMDRLLVRKEQELATLRQQVVDLDAQLQQALRALEDREAALDRAHALYTEVGVLPRGRLVHSHTSQRLHACAHPALCLAGP